MKDGHNTLERGKATNCKRYRILTSEVQELLYLNKKNKAIGPDEIATEIITSLEDFGVKKVTCVLSDIYDTGDNSLRSQ